jgi:HSP20 family molecular chaperone IbpA
MQDIERRSQQLAAREPYKVAPLVDIYEGTEETWLVADLPGVTREGLHVEIENDELRLTADAGAFADDSRVQFSRAFRIPLGIDPAKVAADLKDGVLTLKLPKPSEMKPKKIDVRVT